MRKLRQVSQVLQAPAPHPWLMQPGPALAAFLPRPVRCFSLRARPQTAPFMAGLPLLPLLLLTAAGLQACSAARVQLPQLLVAPGGGAGGLGSDGPDCAPTQVHLALGRDASEMHVSWKTSSSTCRSEVSYRQLSGDRPGRTANAVGYSFLLSERDMCSGPAASNTFMANLHRAVLRGLVPGAAYEYAVAGAGRSHTFTAPPRLGPDAAFTFVAFGDMGDGRHARAKSPGAGSTLLRLVQEADARRRPAQLIAHVGDLSYADGQPEIWDSFLDDLQGVAARVPYMVAVGNHEYGYRSGSGAVSDPSGAPGPYQPDWGNFGADSRGECGVMTARRFHMPDGVRHGGDDDGGGGGGAAAAGVAADLPAAAGGAGGAAVARRPGRSNPPFWYSFEYGSVHFTVISTEHALEPGSVQYQWLADDLAGVDRCTTPWLILLLHRPLYVVYPHKSNRDVGEHLQASLEPLLLRHRVDATIAGHVHSYYRTCPVADGECVFGGAASGAGTAFGSSGSSGGGGGGSSSRSSSGGVGGSGGGSGGGSSAGSSVGIVGSSSSSSSSNGRHGITHFVIGSAGRKLSDVEEGQEEWCVASLRVWGYGRFSVEGADRLRMEFVASESGDVLDEIVVRPSAARNAMCD